MMDTDEDYATSAESAHILRSPRNSPAPISRLPDDILLIIFKHFNEETPLSAQVNIADGKTEIIDISDVPACVAVTHVCSHWRKLTLGCSTLWNLISTTSTFWLDIMLERSQEAPLDVKHFATHISMDESLEKVLLYLPRIKRLELCISSREADRVMELLSSWPARMLETCKFLVRDEFLPKGSTTNTIFQGEAPLLRLFDVYNCGRGWLGWTSRTFAGLRTLRIGKTELSDLLTALQCMSSLEQLTFTGELLQSNQLLPINNSKVSLTRLKNIAINGAQNAVSLFKHLTLPVDIKVSIRLFPIEGLQPIADLFSVMDKRHESGPIFRSLRAIQFKQWRYSVQFSTSTTINVCDNKWDPQDGDIRLTIEFTYDKNDVADRRDLVFNICNIIAQPRRQTFFSGQFGFIHVEGPCQGFIGGLTAALRIVEGSPVPYPLLRVLRLQGIQFEGDEFQDLLGVLTMRVQQNAPIDELWLWLCHNLSADEVERCRKVVSAVHV